MRRETQIGVILGIVIIGIIAVFLSTRSSSEKDHLYNVSARSEKDELIYESVATKMENDAFIEETLVINIDESNDDRSATDPKEGSKDNNQSVVVEKTLNEYDNKPVNVVEIIDVEEISSENEPEGLTKEPKKEIVVAENSSEGRVQKTLPMSMVSDNRLKKQTVEKRTESNALKKKKKSLTHKVGKGDNLFSLAKKYYGDEKKWTKIYNANSSIIYDRNSITKGSSLIIPDVEIMELNGHDEKHDITEKQVVTVNNDKTKNIHVVKSGDSLSKISKIYYGDLDHWKLILNANKDVLKGSTNIMVGQSLKIPQINSLAVQNKKKIKLKENNVKSLSAKTERKEKTSKTTYEIKRGDTLFDIAQYHYNDGNKWRKIFNANKKVLKNSNSIPAGKIIVIPE